MHSAWCAKHSLTAAALLTEIKQRLVELWQINIQGISEKMEF